MSPPNNRARFAHIEAWVFDLDNTLYPYECCLFEQINALMTEFITTRLDVEQDEARRLQKKFFTSYGTTLRGLMEKYDVDARDFLAFVHNIDYSPIKANERFGSVLEALPGRKIIFTNATLRHAERVLERLGIAKSCFSACFDIEKGDYLPKPHPNAYRRMLEHCAIDNPEQAIMIDDISANLKPAHALGMRTVLIETPFPYARTEGDEAWIDARAVDLTEFLETCLAR